MKKHLLAAAVAAAVAVPAMAQNVTVSGNINFGLQSVDTGVQGVSAFMRGNEGGISGTDLKIGGSEDLGGGMKASFFFQSDVPTSAAAAPTFAKERSIELSGAFGAIRIGTTDVTSAQGIDAAVSTFGDFGNTAKTQDKSGEVGADKSNTVRWTSPKMNGLTVQVGAGNMTAQSSATDANKTTRIEGVFASYEMPAATIYAGWTQDAGVGAAKLKDNRVGAKASVAGINLGLVLARSDAGSAALSGIKTTVLNAGYNLGAGTSAHVVYAKQKIDGTSNSEGTGYTLGLKKALSKRTTIYGAYSATTADSGATFELQGLGTYSTADKKASIITTGILHTF